MCGSVYLVPKVVHIAAGLATSIKEGIKKGIVCLPISLLAGLYKDY